MAKWKYENTERWEFVRAMPRGGHRLWRERSTGRISLADHSGDGKWVIPCEKREDGSIRYGVHEDNWYGNPSQTDDGPLFFDYDRPIKIGVDEETYRTWVSVPVLMEDGDPSFCGCTVANAFYYVTEFGMRLEVDGIEYLIAEKGMELPFLAEALEGAST